ncbi:pentapeptide repeat-containing protein [Lentzea sp. NPDC058450]|uniref:pentapeptide repeat-containing protein n=1 Tax=Lentzea sp. NPDC058450 TaxID=3346505 RepID=UPI0036549827
MKAKKPMSPWTMPLVSAAILLLTAGVGCGLWTWVDHQAWNDQEKRTLAQLDVVKVASGIALGGGGLFTLYLAARRQRTQEEAQADTNADAEARRITELYTKAVQQLGDEKAPVRLGGLYALERLGQQQPDQRRTIVNVLCAYLRQPYTPPPESGSASRVARPLLRNSRLRAGIRRPEGPSGGAALVEARQEKDVRLTAQRILIAHARPRDEVEDPEYWGEHDIDLTGAVLFDVIMIDCRFGRAVFDRASFVGYTYLSSVKFSGHARFAGTTFESTVNFYESSFESGASFTATRFRADAQLHDTWFSGLPVLFFETSFADVADFRNASFGDAVIFRDEDFGGEVLLDGARVRRHERTSLPPGWHLGADPEGDGEWFPLVRTSSEQPPRPPTPGS